MATKGVKQVIKNDESMEVVLPPTPTQLVSKCESTGAKIVHVAQTYYRKVEDKVESCGITEAGDPDAKWATVADVDVPAKARSMLGMT